MGLLLHPLLWGTTAGPMALVTSVSVRVPEGAGLDIGILCRGEVVSERWSAGPA